jgi:DNA polymerase I-like protein with 3'-5' exonuclease and polymerase domains
MLYDILKIKPVDKNKPRGTGEEILQKMDHPVVKAILEYRGIAKLLSTYIEKMPAIANPKTRRIHASFNQIGADTGRFSSSDPNMQNIPSHNNEIRKMFRASDGYVLLSSDYSAQEPRIAAHMSKDEKMIKAYRDGKDLYVEIASIAYNLPYDECKEFRADGTKNPKGKERRNAAKAIVLGICYGKGVAAIGEDLKISKKKAQEIYDKVMVSFPGLRQLMEDSENMARDLGFVTTVWGRKRRLPNMQLPPYEFSYIDGVPKDFDPLFDDEEEFEDGVIEVDEATKQRYLNQLNRTYSWKEKEKIKARAKEQGILIKDNGGYIAAATRQCVNSRIQGSAADQTKLAMIAVGNDKKLKDLGFRMLLAVHDELIGECPKENAKEVAERFAHLMVEAAKDLSVPSKCDVEITERWYGEPLQIA